MKRTLGYVALYLFLLAIELLFSRAAFNVAAWTVFVLVLTARLWVPYALWVLPIWARWVDVKVFRNGPAYRMNAVSAGWVGAETWSDDDTLYFYNTISPAEKRCKSSVI